ncbi:P-loop containing nucleoside triphosphate hydrolase protein [Bisporella sp. PMI_857]|nr:P-loop containing nucleoside triphosphate hydrolase protein [Bisporella sp. PMI_857]
MVPLGTDEQNRHLLDQVDKLRECGVDEYIDLPQIVVVGDQSAGKSSILEGLTDIPFPRKSVKCTRFATQIRLRRSLEVRRVVKIYPHNECTQGEIKRLAEFEETIEDDLDLESIFNRALEVVFPRDGENRRFLSKNTLSIEVSGPEQPHLTVIDMPGFIHSESMDQTTADIADIQALARQYIKKERTIILPVVSGDIEYSKQIVLRIIKELDPKGIRTLGIITKPDMTLTTAREAEFINLAANKDHKNKLQLGWHVLRNRSHDEDDFGPEERKQAEAEFFASSNWSRILRADQLGIDALSKRLSTQLIRHIAAEVFKVEADVERELQRCKEKLQELGEGIGTVEEMEIALYAWCERSARLTNAAVQGHGVNPPGEDFFPSFDDGRLYARNFRSRLVKENQRFAEEMERFGSSCLIIGEEGSTISRKGKLRTGDGATSLPEIRKTDYIAQEVIPLLRDNPGKELVMDNNPLLVFRLFHSYSSNWERLATQHIEATHRLCEEFLDQILDYAWPKRIESRVWSGFIKTRLDYMRLDADNEMRKLLDDRMKLITPYESDFLRQWYDRPRIDAPEEGIPSPEDMQYEDVLRKMLLLYQSKLKNFTANTIVQVVERHIADGLEDIFHNRRVKILDKDQIKALVEDDYQVRTERQEFKIKEKTFLMGKEICRKISRRSDLGPYEPSQLSQYEYRRPNSNDNANLGAKPTRKGQKYAYPLLNNSQPERSSSNFHSPYPTPASPVRRAPELPTTPIDAGPRPSIPSMKGGIHGEEYDVGNVNMNGTGEAASLASSYKEEVGEQGHEVENGNGHRRKGSKLGGILGRGLGKKDVNYHGLRDV